MKGISTLVAVVTIVILGLATLGGILVYREISGGVQYTSAGIPVYPKSFSVAVAEENRPTGVTVEAYQTSASKTEVVGWLEDKMTEKGWEKKGSQAGEVYFSKWEKEGRGITLLVGPAEEMGRIFGIRASGTVFIFLTGSWETIYNLQTKDVAPPSIRTSQATGVGPTYATLNAAVGYGVYSSVQVRFRWRKVGGSWNFTPWETWNRSFYDHRLSNLEQGTRYEFEAEIKYDNKTDGGGILEFKTEAEGENLSPPSIKTGMAVEVTETSALLTATLTYGDYQRVDVCFRWREAGGTWNYVPWYQGFTGPSCAYRLTTLSPGRMYEFQALLRYDGKELTGEIRSFTTLRPGGGMSMTATVRGVYFPEMSFTARLTSDRKVLLTVQSGGNIQAGDWEWRAENEDGPVTSFVIGTETLSPGSSVVLDVSSLVEKGSLGVGDWIRIKHSPSGFYYSRVVIS
ncbi:MAG: hypothetical protein DSO03_03905 [Hadesarchaea archaeon]|nr:MAG: hypothetical protein DSO03_03905 [Hadesarchaea archaeon]